MADTIKFPGTVEWSGENPAISLKETPGKASRQWLTRRWRSPSDVQIVARELVVIAAGAAGGRVIVCVGRNYTEHARELGNEVPKVPLIFLKPPSSIIPNGGTILHAAAIGPGGARSGAGRCHWQARQIYHLRAGKEIHLRLHHRERHHSPGPAENG